MPDIARSDPLESDELYVSKDFTASGGFTSGVEGPACDIEGNLYAVNFNRQGTIGKVTPEGEASVFVELPSGSTGNGIRFDSRGDMLIADYTGHNILRVNMATREISVHAHESSMNQPNDLSIADDDTIYASDPDWQGGKGSIWRIGPDGSVDRLDTIVGTTNGIEVATGDSTLYVNASDTQQVWAYDREPGGAISNKRLHIDFPDFRTDGMRCDNEGNLYVTRIGKGTVAKVAPDGTLIREIETTGTKPSNIAFGGPDGRTCYVTMAGRGNIETFRAEAPGRSWQMYRDQVTFADTSAMAEPDPFSISGNYPNPFNATTAIDYRVNETTHLELSVFSVIGQRIATLYSGVRQPGTYTTQWNAGAIPSGVYFLRITGSGKSITHKMTMLR